MPTQYTTIDEYLAPLPADQRTALEKLRKTIRSIIPDAEECISYGLPTFKLEKKVVAFGAAAKHCALYPLSGATIEQFQDDLTEYATSKGAIRFTPDKPLPVALVRKIVNARLAENAALAAR